MALAGRAALAGDPARRGPAGNSVRRLGSPVSPGLEIQRGRFRSLLPLTGPRTTLPLDDLAYERIEKCQPTGDRPIDRRPAGLKRAVQVALDWETVTPLDAIPRSSIPNQLSAACGGGKRRERGSRDGKHALQSTRSCGCHFKVAGIAVPGQVASGVCAPSAFAAFQAMGGGENQLIQTGGTSSHWACPSGCSRPGPIGSSEPGSSTSLACRTRDSSRRGGRARGVPVVLSPICWYEPRAMLALSPIYRVAPEPLAWSVLGAMPRLPSWRRELLALANAVLPNSPSEAVQLARLFGVDRRKLRVVPNGVRSGMGSA